ncbi:MAG: asparagine synthase (glutamine-hydrolyzing) [Candidatus Hydrogenedentota bacterium]|nr:MAG: asparagine synthase (glutamine-hydrolyzing) [Candidatus Hydrogenedentota bacterium]
MCGIAGGVTRGPIEDARIQHCLRVLHHRGPDHQAFMRDRVGDREVTLLHTRLSIIDLDPRAHQPFTRGGVTVVFNGEIYNYVELREELSRKGSVFRTNSDTEVLLEAWRAWDIEAFDRCEGMWALALWDSPARRFLLSRDRFGEKPLYLFDENGEIFFASEIKGLAALIPSPLQVNRGHLLRYLVNGYKALYKTKETYFEGVRELEAGTFLEFVLPEMKETEKRYWTLRYEPEEEMSREEAVAETRRRLLEAVRLRLRSDVPLAFCLSGGVDSAALASIAAREFDYNVSTFSIIDKDERYNETENILATVNDIQCEHKLIEIPREGFLERLRNLVKAHDAPLATISYYVHSFLTEAIAEKGYRVSVSGTAADELFTGYYDHFNLYLHEMRDTPFYEKARNDWERFVRPMVRNPFLKDPELYDRDPDFRDHIYLNRDLFLSLLEVPFSETFEEEPYSRSLLRTRMLNELFHEAIPVILHEDDLNAMKESIENRSPYLDRSLAEFAYRIPNRFLMDSGYGKSILREAVKGILNDAVRLDRRKRGFNASFRSLLDLDDEKVRRDLLSDGPVFELINRERLEPLLDRDPLPNSVSKFLFNFVNVRIFLEEFAS